ncbi:amphiphysin-like [Megalops cyprinoides]|uniref:amphiphysin-like n=1 Tax=Megalops cyprinoides TaxID=118141 RepID=UPI0018643218|nr:amphiphysin-like [Megalops cyprinoides]
MADIKTGIFAKNVQKRLSRAQEKVLQKLGKADETKDEQFEGFVQNFKKQEVEGSRLQREMKAYLAAVKGMQQASMNLTESLHEVYEPDWHGKDDVLSIGKSCDALWEDFHQKLVDSSLITLDTYLGQFPDIKTRIAKRSRKLIDYDSARHHLETLQASNIRNERKISKAEEEFSKAQKVFDELNVDLQEELPSLWDSRVGFYVNTFKNVTNLESKFHREIAVLCHKLYEVMTKLGEQHADKAFTIQGAPSDSGPLRLARTPSPSEDESPLASPIASPNHMLAPASTGPPRPKSPSQLRKGPPVPPPPKVTPTKELHQEQIISLFDDNFVPEISVTTPSQTQKAGESLLDLDFDPFKPDSTTPIGQSPMSQTLPWDLWTTSAGPPQPVSNNSFNGFSQLDTGTSVFTADSNQSVFDMMPDTEAVSPAAEVEVTCEPVAEPGQAQEPSSIDASADVSADAAGAAGSSPPAEKAADIAETEVTEPPTSVEAETAEKLPLAEAEKEPPAEEAVKPVPAKEAEKGSPSIEALAPSQDVESPKEQAPEKMSVPSVVIEPASSNEGDNDHNDDITSPTTPKDNGVMPDSQQLKEGPASPEGDKTEPAAAPRLPPDFLYKETPEMSSRIGHRETVDGFHFGIHGTHLTLANYLTQVETMHDFEAANTDELDLKKGDVVLVVTTVMAEDQDAGWLTGIKESDWLQQGDATRKGLFPENFTQRLA